MNIRLAVKQNIPDDLELLKTQRKKKVDELLEINKDIAELETLLALFPSTDSQEA